MKDKGGIFDILMKLDMRDNPEDYIKNNSMNIEECKKIIKDCIEEPDRNGRLNGRFICHDLPERTEHLSEDQDEFYICGYDDKDEVFHITIQKIAQT